MNRFRIAYLRRAFFIRARAFTLIELLIVVAIIAILAAIAVPNFLEAQTRAKVSRVANDMRTISVAMEAYFIDNNSYTNDSDNIVGQDGYDGLVHLTTPIAFITRFPQDPFQTHLNPLATKQTALYYALGSGADQQGWGKAYGPQGADPVVQSWIMFSVGPDGANGDKLGDNTSGSHTWPWDTTCLTYDPTNGTVSVGDMYRVGGSISEGRYYVNGVRNGKF